MMELSEISFTRLALIAYDNYHCEGIADLQNDLNRFTYLNKLFSKYKPETSTNERMIINHIIILYNVFGKETTRFLFFKIKPNYHKFLLPFILYLSRINDYVEINNKLVHVSTVQVDPELVLKLENYK
jgi:hypothetical protein